MALTYGDSSTSSVRLRYTGGGYLDAKMQPVETLTDLNAITRTQRFVGLTVLVLDDGTGNGPREYFLKDGTSNTHWVLKEYHTKLDTITGDDIED